MSGLALNLKVFYLFYSSISFCLCLAGSPEPISPYIRHWEPARFDRTVLDLAHERHELHRRRKRSINYNHHSSDYGPANVIHLQFKAHDR